LITFWAKLQPRGALAVLAINEGGSAATAALDLAGTAGLAACGGEAARCGARDIWAQQAAKDVVGGSWKVSLQPHDSAFVLITPPGRWG
jgi:hypothetical protein